MRRLNEKEMKKIGAGATYTVKCSYCGRKFQTSYWPFLTSKATAKTICEGKLHNHIINDHYGKL